jgi:hypothetical protein
MVTYTIILLLLLAVAVMPMSIETRFTQDELAAMGIHLDPSSIVETR